MKSTKARLLTIIIYLNPSFPIDKVKELISSINNQTSYDFNLLFIFDGYSQNLVDEVKKNNFPNKHIHTNYIFFFDELGSAYAFNHAFQNIFTPFGYFCDAAITLKENFVECVNKFLQKRKDNVSMLNFFVEKIPYSVTKPYVKIQTIHEDFSSGFVRILSNCIFNKHFLKTKKIFQTNFHSYPLQFYLDVAKSQPEWFKINQQLAKYTRLKNVWYNIFDLYEQCIPIFERIQTKNTFENKHAMEIEYLCLVYLLHHFLVTIFKNYPKKSNIQKRAIDFVTQTINTHAQDWSKNIWLNPKNNRNNKKYLSYIRKFKPFRFYVSQAIKSGIFNGSK